MSTIVTIAIICGMIVNWNVERNTTYIQDQDYQVIEIQTVIRE